MTEEDLGPRESGPHAAAGRPGLAAEPAEPAGPAGSAWHRLNPRVVLVEPVRILGPLLAAGAVLLLFGGRPDVSLGLVGVVLLMTGASAARWATTRYRVTDERVELRSGLVVRGYRTVPRDRIRTVEATANLIRRLLGLVSVTIGTGQQGGSTNELTLDGMRLLDADRLRRVLLDRSSGSGATVGGDAARSPAIAVPVAASASAAPRPAPPSPAVPSAPAPPPAPVPAQLVPPAGGGDGGPVLITRIDWAWIRFAPLTLSGLVAVGAVIGAGYNLLEVSGVSVRDVSGIEDAVDGLRSTPVWAAVTILAVAVLGTTVAAAVGLYVESWWDFHLAREPRGVFRIRRGLLTTRSVSIDEKRLRGAEVAEPMLLRSGRGARLSAIATGLSAGEEDASAGSGALLPPAPRAEAHRVAAAVLGSSRVTDPAPLRRHPRAALRRRVVRAVVVATVAVAVLALVDATRSWAWLAAAVLLPAALGLAVDAYRSLGHRLSGRYLVVRSGTVVRRTAALERAGVIGWTVSRSLFQRRAGLCTLTAATAAGRKAYRVRDVAVGQGLELADEAVPGLVAQFLDRGQG